MTLILGYAFLYAPIISLVLYSFNASEQVMVWGGWSTAWYGALFRNHDLLQAAWVSLRVALLSATGATILGTMAALILTKLRPFRGKKTFHTLITAPLVMPEIIIGVAFLLLFLNLDRLTGVSIGGGLLALTIAHTTLSIAYVCSIVSAQLMEFDDTLIEAAQDLGASPFRAFWQVTFPIIMPSLFSGWLLSFVLSLDDVVVSSFVAAPQSTTLPMLIYSSVKFGLTPQINALATLIIGCITLCILVAAILQLRQFQTQSVRSKN